MCEAASLERPGRGAVWLQRVLRVGRKGDLAKAALSSVMGIKSQPEMDTAASTC